MYFSLNAREQVNKDETLGLNYAVFSAVLIYEYVFTSCFSSASCQHPTIINKSPSLMRTVQTAYGDKSTHSCACQTVCLMPCIPSSHTSFIIRVCRISRIFGRWRHATWWGDSSRHTDCSIYILNGDLTIHKWMMLKVEIISLMWWCYRVDRTEVVNTEKVYT